MKIRRKKTDKIPAGKKSVAKIKGSLKNKDVRRTSQEKNTFKKAVVRKKIKRLLNVIKSLLVMALLMVTLVYTALSPFFNISVLKVEGSTHYNSQSLISASGIKKGENGFRRLFENPFEFYRFRIRSSEEAIAREFPYIKEATVRYKIPDTISIGVVERVAAAIVSVGGEFLIVDRDRYLLEVDLGPPPPGLPVIRGVDIESYKPGNKLEIQEETLLSAIAIFDIIKESDKADEYRLLPSVDYIELTKDGSFAFSLQSRVMVNLGKAEELHYKINAVRTIFTKNIKNNERGKLDLSFSGNPVFTPENGG